MTLKQSSGVSREGWRWVSGALIPFSPRNLGNLFIWTKKFQFATSGYVAGHFWFSASHRPWNWGLIVNARSPGRVFVSNHRWYIWQRRAHWQFKWLGWDRYALSLCSKLMESFVSTVLHTLDQLATWMSFDIFFYSFKCSLNSKSRTFLWQDVPVDQELEMPTGLVWHQCRYARYFSLWAST